MVRVGRIVVDRGLSLAKSVPATVVRRSIKFENSKGPALLYFGFDHHSRDVFHRKFRLPPQL
jgi:hypothetical protein